MSLIPLQHRLHLALNADRSAHPSTLTWTDFSTRVLNRAVSLSTGPGEEATRLQPATASFELTNLDGYLTPGNQNSPHWPYIRLNTPLRWAVAAGVPSLATGIVGDRATTADHASLDIIGDWSLVVEVEPTVPVPPSGTNYDLIGKRVTPTQQSTYLAITPAGKLFLRWSTDGTSGGQVDAFSSVALPRVLWDTLAFGAWLDVNNEAGGHTVHFYAARTLAALLADVAGSEFGDPWVGAGITSVFASTAPLEIGDVGTGFTPYPGRFRRAQVRSGDLSTGTIVADPDFTAAAVGATGLTDSAGRSWTFPALDRWQTQLIGEVVSIEPEWTDGDPGLPTVRITAASITRRLRARDKPLKSALTRKITAPANADNLIAFWPWEDGSDSPQASSPLAGVEPMLVVGFRFGADTSLPATEALANLASGQSGGWNGNVPPGSSTDWSINWFVNIPSIAATTISLQVATSTNTVRQWVVSANSTDVIISGTNETGGGVFLATFPWGSVLAYPSIIRLHAEQNGGNVDWDIDWIPIQGPTPGSVYGTNGSFAGTLGKITNLANLIPAAPADGISVGQMSVTTGTANNFMAPADNAYIGETAAARYKRICDEEHLPVVVEGDLTDSPRMGPQPVDTLTGVLEDCAVTEQGIQAELRQVAGLGLRTLATLYNQTPRLTLDAGAEELRLPFQPALDDQRIRNDVTARRPNGSSARATTDPPPVPEDTYDDTIVINLEADAGLANAAAWDVHVGTAVAMRYPGVHTDLVVEDHLVDDRLHTGPGDLVQVLDIPQHSPDPANLLYEAAVDTIDTTAWNLKITSSQGSPYEVGVWDDATRGRYDTAASQLAAQFVAGTDTSMSVATTLGPLWTTVAGDFPLELNVGGARLTATACSGASSPQTFTVSATVVNGVAKTVPAGSAVELWRPSIRAR